MTRYVRVGTATARLTMRPSDIPGAGPHSHLEFCDLTGRFHLQDWRDWSLLDCDLTGVTALPPGPKLDFIESRRTDWPVGIIPDDIRAHNHDLNRAYFAQKALAATGDWQAILNRLLTMYAQRDYSISRDGALHDIVSNLPAVDVGRVLSLAENRLAASPRLLAEVRRYRHSATAPAPPNLETNLRDLRVVGGGANAEGDGPLTLDISGDILPTRDRWLVKEHLEATYPDVRFWVPYRNPLFVFALSRRLTVTDEEWWFERFWR